jgi:oligoendopeptidase F
MSLTKSDFGLRFLDAGANLGKWEDVQGYYQDLESRSLSAVDALEVWLLDLSELDAWLDEEEAVRYVEMTCQTDDPDREKRYLDFIEGVVPQAKTWSHKLDRKFLECGPRDRLSRERYGVLARQIENRARLFREENIPLQTEDEKLRQQYQKLVGGLTVEHEGREQTMQEMARYLEEPDRATRQAAWEKMAGPWRSAREESEAIYDQMVSLRHRMALNAGLSDYREYAFRALERFDYTAADCEAFASAIEQIAVPAARRLAAQRKERLGVERLRPWDMAVDPQGRPALKPFESTEALVAGCGRIFGEVDPLFGEQFGRMRREELLDLSSRKGKAPGGYMMVYEGRRLPFIFMNAVGRHDDVHTLLHEGGHAFHAFAVRDEKVTALRQAPTEFAEVASMAMELLAGPHLEVFYEQGDRARACADHFENIIRFFPWMAMVDMFQHWVYTHPEHSAEERKAAWLDLSRRFDLWVDYEGYEDVRSYSWHRKGHPFTVPFYYVEYGIAQLGALGVWLNSQKDVAGAVRAYQSALALGGRRPLPELFAAANIQFDFSAAALRPAVGKMQSQLAAMGA